MKGQTTLTSFFSESSKPQCDDMMSQSDAVMSHSDEVTAEAEGPHLGHMEVDLTLYTPSKLALRGFMAVPSAQGQ